MAKVLHTYYLDVRPIGASGSVLAANPSTGPGISWTPLYDSHIAPNFAISSFSLTSPTSILINGIITGITFAATYNYTPSGAVIGATGFGNVTLSSPFTSATITGTVSGAVVGHELLVNLRASGQNLSGPVPTSYVKITWLQNSYWGVKIDNGTYNGGTISAIPESGLRTGHAVEFTANATGLNYIWYAARAAWGTPYFTDKESNLKGGFTLMATATFVNSNAYSESFQIWRSDQQGLGSRTIIVNSG